MATCDPAWRGWDETAGMSARTASQIPAGVGVCLSCPWATSSGDVHTAVAHTRSTSHPTVYRPRDATPDDCCQDRQFVRE